MARPVVCLESGEVFPSYSEAARAYGLSGTDIRKAAVAKTSVKGLNWRFAYQVSEESLGQGQSVVPDEKILRSDGRTFPSLAAAARSVGESSFALRRAIEQFRPCGGMYWRWVKEQKQ